MNFSTTCKFCHKPITLEIDDSYDVIADPHKLIPLSSCNHCADVRVSKRNLEERLKAQCYAIQLLKSARVPVPDKARSNLEFLTKEYAKMVAKWNRNDGMLWDEGIVDALLARPQDWGPIVGRLWRMYKDWRQSQSQQEMPV